MNFRIKQLRKQRNLTQTELAEALHVSQAAITTWESGKRIPPTEEVIRIADFFGVTIDYLLYHDIKPTLDITSEIDETSMPSDAAELERFVRRIVDQALDERQ